MEDHDSVLKPNGLLSGKLIDGLQGSQEILGESCGHTGPDLPVLLMKIVENTVYILWDEIGVAHEIDPIPVQLAHHNLRSSH